MPVRVGLGTCGSVSATGSSCSLVVGPRRLISILRLQSLTDCRRGFLTGLFIDADTNKERKADTETTMTAMLDSCCCQNASQTISTAPFASLITEILTMAATIITIERHRDMPTANFCRTSTRTSHNRTTGKDKTMISVITSTAVVAAVSRMALDSPAEPEQAAFVFSSAFAITGDVSTYIVPHRSSCRDKSTNRRSVLLPKPTS